MRVLLKREDLTHTGSHKINNVLGQALLTRRMGKRRVIAETGAGQHGVATATAAALFGLDCLVFMGAVDVERQALNVFRMKMLGADVVPVTERQRDAQGRDQRSAARLGRDGRDHALLHRVRRGPASRTRGWCGSSNASSATRRREQCRAMLGGDDPDLVVACVGGGSNAIGTFAGFLDTPVAAGGRRGRRLRVGVGSARRVGEPGRARRAARRPLAVPAGRRRPDPRGALDQCRPRLPGRRARARGARGRGQGRVRVRDRRRSRRRLPAPVGHRGDRARARAGARDRMARPRGRTCGARRAPRCWSRCRAGATRTRPRSRERLTGERVGDRSLEAHLRARREAGHKLLVPYVTGGLGGDWLDVVRALADAGADAVEVGIPFSDPVMDGVTIQEASRQALEQRRDAGEHHRRGGGEDCRHPARGDDLHATPSATWASAGSRPRSSARASRAAILPDLPLDELDAVGGGGRRRRRGDGAARGAAHARRSAARDLRAVARLRLRRRR